MRSIWIETADRPQFAELRGTVKTDVLIIGGGMAGVLCAYMLKQAGVDCVLAEADRIGMGITKNTTAKITLQHGLLYDQMIRRFGCEKTRLYLAAHSKAMEQYRALCRTVSCDYEELPSYVYSLTDRAKIEKEADALGRAGIPARFVEQVPLPFSVAGAVCVERQAQFHPLRFLYGIAKDLPIYENTKITELRPGIASAAHGRILADKIIVTTHFPFLNKHGAYFLKLYQSRSYVLALKQAPDVHGMYVDADDKGLSFRNFDGLLLLGGGGHRTGMRGGGWQELAAFAKKHYPSAEEVGRWATQDCMTLDGIPYIGQYARSTPELFVATGFNKWGMTSSMVSAMLLTDLVQGKKNAYAEVFSPSRSILRPQLISNAAHTLCGLLTPTVPRCPHLGCALHYNPQEHSWDCACHGSRFAGDGTLLNNPATGNKKNMPKRK